MMFLKHWFATILWKKFIKGIGNKGIFIEEYEKEEFREEYKEKNISIILACSLFFTYIFSY